MLQNVTVWVILDCSNSSPVSNSLLFQQTSLSCDSFISLIHYYRCGLFSPLNPHSALVKGSISVEGIRLLQCWKEICLKKNSTWSDVAAHLSLLEEKQHEVYDWLGRGGEFHLTLEPHCDILDVHYVSKVCTCLKNSPCDTFLKESQVVLI